MSSKLPKIKPETRPQTPKPVIGMSKTETSLFSGPLPTPEMLEKYEQIYPGIAERILQMAEKEQTERHRQKQELIELEKKNQRDLNFNIRLGLFLGFGSVLISSGMCMYFAYLGNVEAAANAAKWVIASLAGVFVAGRYFSYKSKAKE